MNLNIIRGVTVFLSIILVCDILAFIALWLLIHDDGAPQNEIYQIPAGDKKCFHPRLEKSPIWFKLEVVGDYTLSIYKNNILLATTNSYNNKIIIENNHTAICLQNDYLAIDVTYNSKVLTSAWYFLTNLYFGTMIVAAILFGLPFLCCLYIYYYTEENTDPSVSVATIEIDTINKKIDDIGTNGNYPDKNFYVVQV